MRSANEKVIAITGAGSGIGRALALHLAEKGAHVALSDINEVGLAETVSMLGTSPGRVTSQRLDVSDKAGVFAWAEQVEADHGVVHGIINNAGVSLSSTVANMSYEDLEWVMNINFWGVIHGTKAFLPKILSAGEGSVVNVSSIFGIVGIPSQSAYNAAKFAVRGFTEALRQELLGTGVYALSVHPGGIKTNIVNNGRHKEDASGRPVTTEKLGRQFDKMAQTTPSKAAQIIVRAMLQERGRVLVGTDAVWMDRMQRTFPEDYAAITRRIAQMPGNRK